MQHARGIDEHAIRAGPRELVLAVAARQQADPERARGLRGVLVDELADDDAPATAARCTGCGEAMVLADDAPAICDRCIEEHRRLDAMERARQRIRGPCSGCG